MAGVPGYPPERLFVQLQNTALQQKDPQLYQLIYLMIQQLLKLTGVTAGLTPGTPSGSTVINNIIYQLGLDSGSGGGDGGGDIGPPGQAGSAGADGANGMVPYYVAPVETFTVSIYKQALWSMNIDNEGTIVVDGYLIEVDGSGGSSVTSNTILQLITEEHSEDNSIIQQIVENIVNNNQIVQLITEDHYEDE